MRIALIVSLLFVGLGCSGGLTEEQVVALIDERDAEVERVTQKAVDTIKSNMDDSETRIQQASEDLADHLVETLAAESAKDIVELKQYVDGEVKALQGEMADGFLGHRSYMVEQILGVEKFMNDAEANIREVARAEGNASFAEVKRVADEMLETVQRNTELLIRAVCEADYWALTALSMGNAIRAYLEGDGTTLEEIDSFLYGIVIEPNYNDYSAVCTVDADGRWQLIRQPDKILPERRG